jgi:hypothetical protein
MNAPRYKRGQYLRHHGGSVWRVMSQKADGCYRIRCVIGTTREGWIGGETAGTVCECHANYLHGDGWTRDAAPWGYA